MDDEGEPDAELDALAWCVFAADSEAWRLRRRPEVIRTRERNRTRGMGGLTASCPAELSALASRGALRLT